MVGKLLVRGMIAGLVAGLLAALFAWLTGEPSVDAAIGLEEAGAHDHGAEVEVVSRGVQSTLGLTVGVTLLGIALGGIVALVFAFAYGRVGRGSVGATALGIALAGWVSIGLVPFVKYPANPPGVGDAATISQRSSLYFTLVVSSVLFAVIAAYVVHRYADRPAAALLACGGYLVAVVVVAGLLPAVNEVPAGFPAALLWDFRLASMGLQLVLWTAIGMVFGRLARPVLGRSTVRAPSLAAPRA